MVREAGASLLAADLAQVVEEDAEDGGGEEGLLRGGGPRPVQLQRQLVRRLGQLPLPKNIPLSSEN